MTRDWTVESLREDEQVPIRAQHAADDRSSAFPDTPVPASSAVGPFLLGTVVGGLAGAVVGTALSPHTRRFVVGLYHLVNRRLASSERDQLRFELLLQ